jgi:hypothetical protein
MLGHSDTLPRLEWTGSFGAGSRCMEVIENGPGAVPAVEHLQAQFSVKQALLLDSGCDRRDHQIVMENKHGFPQEELPVRSRVKPRDAQRTGLSKPKATRASTSHGRNGVCVCLRNRYLPLLSLLDVLQSPLIKANILTLRRLYNGIRTKLGSGHDLRLTAVRTTIPSNFCPRGVKLVAPREESYASQQRSTPRRLSGDEA